MSAQTNRILEYSGRWTFPKKRCFEQQDAGPDACVENGISFRIISTGCFLDFFNIKFYDSIQSEKEQIRQDRRLVGNQKQSQYGRGYKRVLAFNLVSIIMTAVYSELTA